MFLLIRRGGSMYADLRLGVPSFPLWAETMGRSDSPFSSTNPDTSQPSSEEGQKPRRGFLFDVWKGVSVPYLEVIIVVGMILGTLLAGYGIYYATRSAGEELVSPSHKSIGPNFDATP